MRRCCYFIAWKKKKENFSEGEEKSFVFLHYSGWEIKKLFVLSFLAFVSSEEEVYFLSIPAFRCRNDIFCFNY